VGQFFHLHFEQSIEPILPGNPRSRLRAKIFLVSLAVGLRRYSSLNPSMTDLVKRPIETRNIGPAILKYCSKESAAAPYASTCRHAQILCSEGSPKTPRVFFLQEVRILSAYLTEQSKKDRLWYLEPPLKVDIVIS
jgi:hypothetical protein